MNPFGEIKADYGEFKQGSPEWPANLSEPVYAHSETIVESTNLASQWTAITDYMQMIEDGYYEYWALVQNSNTAVDEALEAAGLPEPQDDDTGEFYAPASESEFFLGIRNLRDYCFVATTPIAMGDGSSKPIESVTPGDVVQAFDSQADRGRGAIVAARVARVFRRADSKVIEFHGLRVTPGHQFLNERGTFERLDSILARDGMVVGASGDLVRARTDQYATESKSPALSYVGGADTPPSMPTDYLDRLTTLAGVYDTYNFEVEGYHTYIAGGFRVHNDSIYSPTTPQGATADALLDEISRIAFADDPLAYIVLGSALRSFGSVAADAIMGADPFDALHIFGRFANNAVGALGGFAGRTIIEEMADQIGLPEDLVGPLAIFAENVGTVEAKLAALRVIRSILPETFGPPGQPSLWEVTNAAIESGIPDGFYESQAIDAISSFAASKLVELIGVDPELAPFISVPARAALNQIGQNIAANQPWFSGFDASTFKSLGDVAGAYLANEAADWDSEGELIGSQIGTVIGQTLIPIPVVGAFIGNIIGGLLGGAIAGDTPEAWGYLEYNVVTGEMELTRLTQEAGGSKELAKTLADTVKANVNGALSAIGGEVLNPSVEVVGYGHRGKDGKIRYSPDEVSYDEEYDRLIATGVVETLEQLAGSGIAGGDVYTKRALYESLRRAREAGDITSSTSAIILNDLIVAKDFQVYLENKEIINTIIAADPNGSESIGWQITLQRAFELGLQRRNEVDWIGGWSWRLSDMQVSPEDLLFQYGDGRLFVFGDGGERTAIGDVVPSGSADVIFGDAGSDRIVLGADNYDPRKSVSGDTEGFIAFDGMKIDDPIVIGVMAQIAAGEGHDAVYGGDLGGNIFGETGDDLLQGGKLDDWLIGDEGRDKLFGLAGHGDYLNGGQGQDTLAGDAGDDWLDGGDDTDSLFGATGDDILEGGGGKDFVQGGVGSDTYIYRAGDVLERIADQGVAGESDALVLDGVLPADVSVFFSGSSEDIRIEIAGAAPGVIELLGQALAEGAGIDRIRFEDGTIWTRSQLLAQADPTGAGTTAASGSGALVIEGGSGEDSLSAGVDGSTLKGGRGSDTFTVLAAHDDTDIVDEGALSDFDRLVLSDTASTAVTVTRDATDPSIVKLVLAGGKEIRLLGQDGLDTGVDEIRFSDGVAWSRRDLQAKALAAVQTAGADLVVGSAVAENVASLGGDDTLIGGGGDDTLAGAAGSDTYVFNLGDGHDRVYDNGTSGTDTLKLGAGITVNDVFLSNSEYDTDSIQLSIPGSDDRINLVGQRNSGGVEQLIFADGTVWTRAEILAKANAWAVTGANDVIDGGRSADTLQGGAGDDQLNGHLGSDTYRFNKGDGYDVIDDDDWQGDTDRLVLGAGIAPTDIRIERPAGSPNDIVLRINGTNDAVMLNNQALGGTGVDEIEFADGTIWTAASLNARAIAAATSSSSDDIHGGYTADTIAGGVGDDRLVGGDGNDTYQFNIGDGFDQLIEEVNGGADELVFGAGITSAQIRVTRPADGSPSLLLRIGSTDDAILIGSHLETVRFADGTSWTYAQVLQLYQAQASTPQGDAIFGGSGADTIGGGGAADALEGGGGGDTYTYNTGDGFDHILDSSGTDRVVFGAGIAPADVTVHNVSLSGAGNDIILRVGADGVGLYIKSFKSSGVIEEINFADGTTWTSAQVLTMAASTSALAISPGLTGQAPTSQADRILGTGLGDLLTGGAGDDYLAGAGGSDTYQFNLGDGRDRILDEGGTTNDSDTLAFGAGINPGDLRISRPNDRDFLIRIIGTEDSVYLEDNSAWLGFTNWTGPETISFANGTVWSRTDLFNAYLAQAETAGDDHLIGTGGKETFSGSSGNDLYEDFSGSDLYMFNRGAGRDQINEGVGTTNDVDKVKFGADIKPSDIAVTRPNGTDYLLTIKGTTDSLYVSGQDGPHAGIDLFEFADGTIWDRAGLFSVYLAQHVTAGSDDIVGAHDGGIIQAGAGDDVIHSGGRHDNFVFNLGDGHDVVHGSEDAILTFGEDISPEDIVVTRPEAGGMLIAIAGRPDSIYIDNQDNIFGLETVTFADGTVWTKTDLNARAAATEGGAQVVRGTSGVDVLVGSSVIDRLIGGDGADILRGGGGGDTYVFNLGDGRDAIQDYGDASETDQILLGANIRPEDIQILEAPGDGDDLVLSIRGTDDAIYLDDQDAGDGSGVEQVVFANGTIWNRTNLVPTPVSAQASTGADTIYGTVFADTIAGGTGADDLRGGGGGDGYVFATGDGHDTITDSGAPGDVDYVSFGPGIAQVQLQLSRTSATPEDLLISLPGTDSVLLKGQWSEGVDRIEEVRLDGGQVLDAAALRALYLGQAQTAGTDTVVGFDAGETLAGGTGDDKLFGEKGGDTYVYNTGDGADVIVERGVASDLDVLSFGAGIAYGDLRIARGATAKQWILTFASGAGSVTLDMADDKSADGVDRITFADGTTWTGAQLREHYLSSAGSAVADEIAGSAGADTISGLAGQDTISGDDGADSLSGGADNDQLDGGSGDDTLDGGDGDDLLQGGFGTDHYIGGAGLDTVSLAYSNAAWTVDLAAGTAITVNASETFTSIEGARTGGGADKLIGDANANILSAGDGLDTLTGADGDDTLTGGAGADSIDGGAGGDMATFANSTVGVNVTIGGANLGGDAQGDVLANIEHLTGSGQNDTLTGDANANRLDGGDGADQLLGGDGADTIAGGFGADALSGQLGNDSLNGGDGDDQLGGDVGSDTLIGGLGADSLTGGQDADSLSGDAGADTLGGSMGDDTLDGGADNDTYSFNSGDGADRILEQDAAGTDKLVLGAGLTTTGVAVTRGGPSDNDAILSFGAAGSVTLVDGFATGSRVEEVVFADGTIWTKADLISKLPAPGMTGTNGDDSIVGTSGADVITGGLGNDTLVGGAAGDTYNYSSGHGSDVITESNASGTDKLVLGTGLNASNLVIGRTGSSTDLTLSFTGHTGSIKVTEAAGTAGRGLEQYVFGDATTWTSAQLQAAYITQMQTTGADTIYGFAGVDTLVGGQGNDSLIGGDSGDTYTYASGDGADTIGEINNGGTDKLVLGTGLNASNLVIGRTGSSTDLTLNFTGHTGSIKVTEAAGTAGRGLEQYVFGDATTWTSAQLQAAYITQMQTTGADTIYGFAGVDTLVGGLGNDSLVGGDSGDTYTYASGDGADTIGEINNGGTDKLVLAAGILPTDVTVTKSGNHATLTFAGGGSIVLTDEFNGTQRGVESVEFANSTVWTRSDLLTAAGGAPPIVLDLNGDGVIGLLGANRGGPSIDADGDGDLEAIGWASPEDGFLAIDLDGDGTVDGLDEISFTRMSPGASSDLEALTRLADSNGDGVLDASDPLFNQFGVWQDLDSDAVSDPGEFQSLSERGITSLSLAGASFEGAVHGNVIRSLSSYMLADGTSHALGDVVLAVANDSDHGHSVPQELNLLRQAMAAFEGADGAAMDWRPEVRSSDGQALFAVEHFSPRPQRSAATRPEFF